MQEFAGALAVHTCGTQLAKCQAGWVLFASAVTPQPQGGVAEAADSAFDHAQSCSDGQVWGGMGAIFFCRVANFNALGIIED